MRCKKDQSHTCSHKRAREIFQSSFMRGCLFRSCSGDNQDRCHAGWSSYRCKGFGSYCGFVDVRENGLAQCFYDSSLIPRPSMQRRIRPPTTPKLTTTTTESPKPEPSVDRYYYSHNQNQQTAKIDQTPVEGDTFYYQQPYNRKPTHVHYHQQHKEREPVIRPEPVPEPVPVPSYPAYPPPPPPPPPSYASPNTYSYSASQSPSYPPPKVSNIYPPPPQKTSHSYSQSLPYPQKQQSSYSHSKPVAPSVYYPATRKPRPYRPPAMTTAFYVPDPVPKREPYYPGRAEAATTENPGFEVKQFYAMSLFTDAGGNCPGNTMISFPKQTLEQCAKTCLDVLGCVGFSVERLSEGPLYTCLIKSLSCLTPLPDGDFKFYRREM